jgi:hypothetical protein
VDILEDVLAQEMPTDPKANDKLISIADRISVLLTDLKERTSPD